MMLIYHKAFNMRVSLSGNIGCGKSTMINMLKTKGYDVFQEPVDKWKHLKLFYEDKKRWGFTFQMEVLQSYIACKNISGGLTICERSPWESYCIFAHMLVDEGVITKDEFQLLKQFTESLAWKPDLCIYLYTDPDVSLSRIKIRNRMCESSITIDYLETLHQQYEKTFAYDSIRIDANASEEIVFQKVIDAINKPMKTIFS